MQSRASSTCMWHTFKQAGCISEGLSVGEQGTLGGQAAMQCSDGGSIDAKAGSHVALITRMQHCGAGQPGMDVACISALISHLKGALYKARGGGLDVCTSRHQSAWGRIQATGKAGCCVISIQIGRRVRNRASWAWAWASRWRSRPR